MSPGAILLESARQVPAIERLGEIIIRPQFQTKDLIDFFVLGGQHDDRNLVFLQPEIAADLKPSMPGSMTIQNDQIRRRLHNGVKGRFSVLETFYLKTVFLKIQAHEVDNAFFIIYDINQVIFHTLLFN
jgi:hypothetical protein